MTEFKEKFKTYIKESELGNTGVYVVDYEDFSEDDLKTLEKAAKNIESAFRNSMTKSEGFVVERFIPSGDEIVADLQERTFIDFIVNKKICETLVKGFKNFELDKARSGYKFKFKLSDVK